jgi:hypothetical protein
VTDRHQGSGAEVPGDPGFLSRWSRRKQEVRVGRTPEPEPQAPPDEQRSEEATGPAEPCERIDPRTGKPVSELTDEDMPALESLTQDSDYSIFLAPKVSEQLRTVALRKLFHMPCFNKICLCAEYAEDYTSYEPLGEIVTHDMRQAIEREAQRLAEAVRSSGDGAKQAPARTPADADRPAASGAPAGPAPVEEATGEAAAPAAPAEHAPVAERTEAAAPERADAGGTTPGGRA